MDYLAPKSKDPSNGDFTEMTTNSVSPLPAYRESCYSSSQTRMLLQRLEPFHLSKAELIMILNLRPLNPVLLDAVIEELDQRLSSEQQSEMLKILEDTITKQDTIDAIAQ